MYQLIKMIFEQIFELIFIYLKMKFELKKIEYFWNFETFKIAKNGI